MVLMSIRTLAVLQARMSSSRLPGKVMMEINGLPMIYWQIQRVLKAVSVDKLVVATSVDPTDDTLAKFLEDHSVSVYRGSLDNVFSRYLEVAIQHKYDAIIRLTADCPLVMPELIDEMVSEFYRKDADYLSNTIEPTYPDGLDIEIIKNGALEKLATFELGPKELEHVTYGIYQRPDIFKLLKFQNETDQSLARWTVDYQADLDFVREIFSEFLGYESDFTLQDVHRFLEKTPHLKTRNHGYKRNEGLQSDRNQG
jgi:spore coat polysaccharide biosynthesis protein SpsF